MRAMEFVLQGGEAEADENGRSDDARSCGEGMEAEGPEADKVVGQLGRGCGESGDGVAGMIPEIGEGGDAQIAAEFRVFIFDENGGA